MRRDMSRASKRKRSHREVPRFTIQLLSTHQSHRSRKVQSRLSICYSLLTRLRTSPTWGGRRRGHLCSRRLARLRASRARLMAACHFRSHFSNIGPARSRNPVRQLPSVTVEELSSIFGLARTRKLRWRREHFDVGAAGGEQKAARLCMRANTMMLGTVGTCQTGFRDMGLSSLSAPKQLFRPVRTQSGETRY